MYLHSPPVSESIIMNELKKNLFVFLQELWWLLYWYNFCVFDHLRHCSDKHIQIPVMALLERATEKVQVTVQAEKQRKNWI